MTKTDALLLRAAARLHAMYGQVREQAPCRFPGELEIVRDTYLSTALRHARLLEAAMRHGWPAAIAHQQAEYAYAVDGLASAIKNLCTPERQAPSPPALRELFLELKAARDEFDDFEIKFSEKRVSAFTAPIRLEGVDLGRFRVDLEWDQSAGSDPINWFRVRAQEPNPASSDSGVTHPHVDDDHLCSGDATHPIKCALAEGRLCDFFCLVRSVLETYNAGSAYVTLEDWDGRPCADCGDQCGRDYVYFCDSCEKDYCGDCIRTCLDCSQSGCRSCLTQSEFSTHWVCDSCMGTCQHCGEKGAGSEIENDTCKQCREAEQDDQERDDAAVQAVATVESETTPTNNTE